MAKENKKRCVIEGTHEHMTPFGMSFFLCDYHEELFNFLAEYGHRYLNASIVGGQSTTGIDHTKAKRNY